MWNDAARIKTQAVKLQASYIAIVLSEYFTGYLGNAANEPSERERRALLAALLSFLLLCRSFISTFFLLIGIPPPPKKKVVSLSLQF